MNFISVLNLKTPYTVDDIKKNYKRLVKLYHPDINKDSSSLEKMKEINLAYDYAIKSLNCSISSKRHDEYTNPKNKNIYVDLEASILDILSNKIITVSYLVENNRKDHVDVKLNPNIKYGDRLIFKRKGFSENFNRPSGDLIITIIMSDKDKDKTILDLDVMITHGITYLDIMIGDTTIHGLDNRKIKINLTEEVLSNKRLRLEGKGLPDKNKNGDLYIDLEIVDIKLKKSEKNALEYIRNNL